MCRKDFSSSLCAARIINIISDVLEIYCIIFHRNKWCVCVCECSFIMRTQMHIMAPVCSHTEIHNNTFASDILWGRLNFNTSGLEHVSLYGYITWFIHPMLQWLRNMQLKYLLLIILPTFIGAAFHFGINSSSSSFPAFGNLFSWRCYNFGWKLLTRCTPHVTNSIVSAQMWFITTFSYVYSWPFVDLLEAAVRNSGHTHTI